MSLDVDKALRRAARLMKNAELTAAETIYKDILTSFPKNSKALRGYQRMKSTDVVTGPEGSAPSPQQMQAVMALCHQVQFTEVLSKLDLLLEAFPDAPAVYNLQGASRAALGRYDGAVDSFKRAIKLKPDDARSYFNIGNVQKETGALDAAIANYDSALKIKPDHVAALRNKGNVLQDKGDARAAIASYKSAIEIEPKHALTHYQMGLLCRTSCGSGLGRIFQVSSAMPEQRQKTIVCFCKRSCSGCAPARRGAICYLPLAIVCSCGWANDKDHRVGGCARQFDSVSAAAGASA